MQTIFSPADQAGPVDIIISTYNAVPGVENGTIVSLLGVRIVFYMNTFNPTGNQEDKHPENVHSNDPNFVRLCEMCARGMPMKIIFFAGLLQPSGSDRIIRLFAETFSSDLEVLDLGICDCDRAEKIRLAALVGILPTQMWGFWDNYPRCVDWSPLYGRVIMWVFWILDPELKQLALRERFPKPSRNKN